MEANRSEGEYFICEDCVVELACCHVEVSTNDFDIPSLRMSLQ